MQTQVISVSRRQIRVPESGVQEKLRLKMEPCAYL